MNSPIHALFTPKANPDLLRPQTQQEVSSLALAVSTAARQVRNVGVLGQRLRNLLLRLDPSDHDEALAGLSDSPADGIGSLCFTLGPDDVGLPLLLRLLDDEPRTLGFLLCNLLLFDGLGELLSEGHVGYRHVLERNVELLGTLEELAADTVADGFTLGDELRGVKLGNDSLQNFVTDGWEDTLIVVRSEVLGEQSLVSTVHAVGRQSSPEAIGSLQALLQACKTPPSRT